jgi:hypothetical protein
MVGLARFPLVQDLSSWHAPVLNPRGLGFVRSTHATNCQGLGDAVEAG